MPINTTISRGGRSACDGVNVEFNLIIYRKCHYTKYNIIGLIILIKRLIYEYGIIVTPTGPWFIVLLAVWRLDLYGNAIQIGCIDFRTPIVQYVQTKKVYLLVHK